MNTYSKLGIFALVSILCITSYQYNYISHTTVWIIEAINVLVLFIALTYFNPKQIRERTVSRATQNFRKYCDAIVQYEWYAKNKFTEKDLQKALGRCVPGPVENKDGDKIFTFLLKENFKIILTLNANWFNIGGGMTYTEDIISDYSFGTCKLLEDDIVRAEFFYKGRYINWISSEFQDITGHYEDFERLVNRKKLQHDREQAEIAQWFKEIHEKNIRNRLGRY